MLQKTRSNPRSNPSRSARALTTALLAASLAACDGLMDVEDNPGTIDAGSTSGPGAFQARYIGTQGDFISAFDNATLYGGLFTDELAWGGSFLAREEIDQREARTSNDIAASELYTPLQVAANTSERLQQEILEGVFETQVSDPPNSEQLARVSLFAGYSKLFLADLFCSMAFGGTGPELQPADVYAMAIEDLTQSIDATNAESGVRNAALVARARAHLQLGNTAEALEDALLVPAGFEFTLEYSNNAARQENALYNFTWGNRRLTVATPFHGLTIDDSGVLDPRAAVQDEELTTFNGNIDLWVPLKYSGEGSPIRLASWEEAQYMIAEIRGGADARDIINALRAARGITQVFDPGATATAEEIRAKLIDERARALFLEGQRMGDLRRYLSLYALDRFPTGTGYGDQTCLPLPDLERDNNPDI